MGTHPNLVPIGKTSARRESRGIVLEKGANEFVFAVVGHAGSGTSLIAETLRTLLSQQAIDGVSFDPHVLKARDVIVEWANKNGYPLPGTGSPTLESVRALQDLGDRMRSTPTVSGEPDHAVIARRLIFKIQAVRANRVSADNKKREVPVRPDGKPRAYVLDSLRHPAEVELLRHVYKDAFVLIGVVCEDEKRISRIGKKYADGGRHSAIQFMQRDADAREKHGQHVADAFHLSDFFVDNTVDRWSDEESQRANQDWEVIDNLSRLVKMVTHSELIRPTIAETAMHHAYSARLRSACLSRQVGAALVDGLGNIVATGTNEAPKAGGGVYGESFEREVNDARCAMFPSQSDRYCRNTREQNRIIAELIDGVEELRGLSVSRKEELQKALRKTRIGGLLEFSRAVHAEMDALLSATRKGVSSVGTRVFVTTFPCHYCARHLVAAGVDEVQYIEPYPKSQALNLHRDAIAVEHTGWTPPSRGGGRVLFRPFSGVAPRLYRRVFMMDRDLKDRESGDMKIHPPEWGTPWHIPRMSYLEIEAELSLDSEGNA